MAASIEPEDIFYHDELPDSKTYFRLLRIASAPATEPTEDEMPTSSSTLSCELTSWPLADAPSYRAISYTWGDPKKVRWIQVNGKPMKRRGSLYLGRRDMHQPNRQPREGHQVAKMGSIFERAERVLACIGPHDAHSRPLFPILAQQSKFFVQTSVYFEKYRRMKRLGDVAFRTKLFQWRYLFLGPSELTVPILQVAGRPYLQRVWTLPELWLARGVDILCGADYVPGRALHGLWKVTAFEPMSLHEKLFGKLRIYTSYVSSDTLSYGVSQYLHAICQEPGSKTDMFNLLRTARYLDCENPRDRVYSQLSMLSWSLTGDEVIQPDYDIDLFDLVLKVLRLAIKLKSLRYNGVLLIKQSLLQDQVISLRTAEAIRDRRHVNAIQSTTWMAIESILPIGRYALHFRGYQLRADNNRWKIAIPRHEHKDPSKCLLNTRTESNTLREVLNSLKEPYYLATGDDNQPYALLPVCVQSEDWLVGDGGIGFIILRKRPGDGRYKIIGEARAMEKLHDCSTEAGQRFTIFFEPEDALVLHLHKTEGFNGGFHDAIELDSIARSLGNAVCRTEGSSYAEMGSHFLR
ncbi:hypothetical protein GGR51DRAFT_558879 [Nemania sp. FL0031]|nr:hypothetical protein GGR51DRAFT_558879 [Nemania sp. FL0031]